MPAFISAFTTWLPSFLFHVTCLFASPWCCQRLTTEFCHWWGISPQRCLLAATSACALPWSPRTSTRKKVPRSPREGSVQTHKHIRCWVTRPTHIMQCHPCEQSSGFTWLSWASAALSSTKYIPDFPVRQHKAKWDLSETNKGFPPLNN